MHELLDVLANNPWVLLVLAICIGALALLVASMFDNPGPSQVPGSPTMLLSPPYFKEMEADWQEWLANASPEERYQLGQVLLGKAPRLTDEQYEEMMAALKGDANA